MHEPQFTIEEVSDPDEIARTRVQDKRRRRNSAWLQTHWPDVLQPTVRAKVLGSDGSPDDFIHASVEYTHNGCPRVHYLRQI